MLKRTLLLLTASALYGATAYAGSYTNSFATTANSSSYTLNQPSGTTYPVIQNGELVLLPNQTSFGPVSIVLNDLDNGAAIDSLTASFDLQLGPGTSTPADGIFIAFGPEVSSYTTWGEEGPTMTKGFGVEIDTYRNLDEDPWDDIGFDINVAGNEIASYPFYTAATLVDSAFHHVTIQLNKNGTFNFTWNGQVFFTNLILTGWAPTQGQFGIGGRNGGDSEQVAIQNLSVTTTLAPATVGAPTITTQPKSVTVAEGSPVAFTVDCETDAPLTIQWALNGTTINGATNWLLAIPRADYVNSGAKYTCTIANTAGSVSSSPAVLTVTPSTVAPNVVTAAAVQSGATVMVGVQFDKALDPASAGTAANYSIAGGQVTAATYQSSIPVEALTLGSTFDPMNAQANNGLATPPTTSGVVLTVTGLTPSHTYTLAVNNVASDNGVKMTAAQSATFALQQTYSVTDADVGTPTLAGSMSSVVDPFAGTVHYTVLGGGDDIWNASSDFHFAYAQVTGDFDFMVQVTSLVGPDTWTKAELMCDGWSGSGTPQGSDPFVSSMTTQEGSGVVENDIELQDRPTAGGTPGNAVIGGITPTYPNCWLRLTRSGSNFLASASTDGTNWVAGQSLVDTAGAFGASTLVGLAVTAHEDSDTVGGIATFDHFGDRKSVV